jgi:hypothetical protein
MGDERRMYMVLVGKPVGKKPLGDLVLDGKFY